MGKWIIGGALAGWAAIIGLAYRLASARIDLCDYEKACIIRATAVRDNVLITGLIVALVGLIVLMLVLARRTGRLNGWVPANRGESSRLR